MMELKSKKAALFDLGSTLIEYENIPWDDIYVLCLKRAYDYLGLENINRPEWDKFYQAFLKMVIAAEMESLTTYREKDVFELFRNYLASFGIDGDSGFHERFLKAYYRPIRENLTLKKNAREVLEYCRAQGHKLGLISNTIFPSQYHKQDMRDFGIYDYFDHMLFSSEYAYRKPHQSIFEEMLRKLDISAPEAFFVGDRPEIDILGAKNSGIYSILILKRGREYDDLTAADLVIENLSELIDNY
jgi:HAD superfamily hydrolase (TIGR01549 family)